MKSVLKSDAMIKDQMRSGLGASHVGFYDKLAYDLVKFDRMERKNGKCYHIDNKELSSKLGREGYYFCDHRGNYTYYLRPEKDVVEYMKNYMCESEIGSITAKKQGDTDNIALYCGDKVMIASYRLIDLNAEEFYNSARGIK